MAKTPEMTLTAGQAQNEPMSIIITGGLGCVGLAIMSCLSKRLPHANLHILDVSLPKDCCDSEDKDYEECGTLHKDVTQYHKIDVTDYTSILELFRVVKPRVVIHTAALVPSAARKLGVGNEGL